MQTLSEITAFIPYPRLATDIFGVPINLGEMLRHVWWQLGYLMSWWWCWKAIREMSRLHLWPNACNLTTYNSNMFYFSGWIEDTFWKKEPFASQVSLSSLVWCSWKSWPVSNKPGPRNIWTVLRSLFVLLQRFFLGGRICWNPNFKSTLQKFPKLSASLICKHYNGW